MTSQTKEQSIFEQISNSQTPLEELASEFDSYHAQVYSEGRGRAVSVKEYLGDKLKADIDSLYDGMKGNFSAAFKSDLGSQEKMLREAGKIAYLASTPGASESGMSKEELNKAIEDTIAKVGGRRGETYTQVMAGELATDKPYETTDDRGRATLLGNLLGLAAQSNQKENIGSLKGLSLERMEYVKGQLNTPFAQNFLMERYGDIWDHEACPYNGAFADNAPSGVILNTVEAVLSGQNLNTKNEHYKMNDMLDHRLDYAT